MMLLPFMVIKCVCVAIWKDLHVLITFLLAICKWFVMLGEK